MKAKSESARAPLKLEQLCEWLRANSSGIYRPAAEAADEIERLAAENARLLKAIWWACGEDDTGTIVPFEPDDDEPLRPDGQPTARYWWRSKLRKIAGL